MDKKFYFKVLRNEENYLLHLQGQTKAFVMSVIAFLMRLIHFLLFEAIFLNTLNQCVSSRLCANQIFPCIAANFHHKTVGIPHEFFQPSRLD